MQRTYILLLAILLSCAYAYASEIRAPEMPVPVQVPLHTNIKRPIVLFPHTKHATVPCRICHHQQQGASVAPCTVAGCHDLGSPQNAKERNSVKYFRNAFHKNSPSSCSGCHKMNKANGKATGPTECRHCHTR